MAFSWFGKLYVRGLVCVARAAFGQSLQGVVAGEGIFLTRDGELAVLTEQPYATEDVLQRALAEHPEVIAGPTTSDSKPGNLLLVRREMGVPDAGGSAVWSLDHLFLDAEGVPVVVEVKRSSDTRIRREVIGQMLDYAANGVKYWPVADLRGAVDQAAAEAGKAGEDLVAALRPGLDPEEYWKTVEANLAAGRIRMLFVADKLPPELVRVIEFLNEQMNPAEVLGVELPRYVGSGNTVYVPRVVGRTSAAVDRKKIEAGQLWNEESFLDAARTRRPRPKSPSYSGFWPMPIAGAPSSPGARASPRGHWLVSHRWPAFGRVGPQREQRQPDSPRLPLLLPH